MSIEGVKEVVPVKGWLEINPAWIAEMFGLKATGRARTDMLTGKLLVEVEDPRLPHEGDVVEGTAQIAVGKMILPTGWRLLGRKREPV